MIHESLQKFAVLFCPSNPTDVHAFDNYLLKERFILIIFFQANLLIKSFQRILSDWFTRILIVRHPHWIFIKELLV